MKVIRFEELICWQKARALTNAVYDLARLPGFARDFEPGRQIRSAAISSMSNIAEGFERWTRKELARFLDIAKGSAGEVRSQLYVALDQHYISPEQFQATRSLTEEVSKTIVGLIACLESHPVTCQVRESAGAEPLDLPNEFCHPLNT